MFITVKNECMSSFAVTAAQVIFLQERADYRVLDICQEGLPVAGTAQPTIGVIGFITIGCPLERNKPRVTLVPHGFGEHRRDGYPQGC